MFVLCIKYKLRINTKFFVEISVFFSFDIMYRNKVKPFTNYFEIFKLHSWKMFISKYPI